MELLRSPNNYFALCWCANSLYFSGKDHEAASLYERAIKVNPEHPLAHAGLGRIHYGNALRIHQEYRIFPGGSWVMFADEINPEDLENKKKILIPGYADSQVGNRQIAIKELEKAAALSNEKQDKVDLLYMEAVIHCIIDNKQAIKAYKRVLRLDPEHIHARYDLAGCYAALGDSKSALHEYEYLKEHAPEEASDLEPLLTKSV
jgi:tetratricopeptide (TPR) repeat protein